MTKLIFEDDNGIYTIEVKEEFNDCEALGSLIEWGIMPLLKAAGYSEKTIKRHMSEFEDFSEER